MGNTHVKLNTNKLIVTIAIDSIYLYRYQQQQLLRDDNKVRAPTTSVN